MTTQQQLASEVASRLRQLADMVEKSDAHIVTFNVRAELDNWRADIAILGGNGALMVPHLPPRMEHWQPLHQFSNSTEPTA